MKTLCLRLLAILMSATLSSCVSDRCEGVPRAGEATISLHLLKASGFESFFTRPTTYNRDSVRVSDEQGKTVPLGRPPVSDLINFSLFENTKLPALGRPVTRQFLLYLKRNDQDTIRVECELYKTECTNADLKNVTVFYNNRKVHEGSDAFLPELIIRKP